MKIANTDTPVLVLGATEHGSLGIIRSLGRLGIAVYAVESMPLGPAAYSKYCKVVFAWNLIEAPEAATIRKLIEIGRSIGQRTILIPTWDELACMIDRHYETLSPYFVFPHQRPELLSLLSSKAKLHDLARQHGVPTPRIAVPYRDEDIEAFSQRAQFPIVLKRVFGNQRRLGAAGAAIVHNAADLQQRYQEMREPGFPNVMLQEYIVSPDTAAWMFNGYLNQNSECLAGFTGHKIRHTPIHSGMTSLGVCKRNDELQNLSERFLKAIGYRGMVDIDYCFDARDQKYKILDVNPRVGASFRLFVDQNGLDVIRAMYLDVTGQSVPKVEFAQGRRWLVERDFISAYRQFREGTLTIGDWVSSMHGIDEFGYFAWDDLRPVARIPSHMLRRSKKSTIQESTYADSLAA